jgi:hypothetical protein
MSKENVTTLARYFFSEAVPYMKPVAESIAFEYSIWNETVHVEETWRECERVSCAKTIHCL